MGAKCTIDTEGEPIEYTFIDGRHAISAYDVGRICEFAEPEHEVETRFKTHPT